MTVATGSNNQFHTPMLVALIRTAVVCLLSTSHAPFLAGRALQAAGIISTGSLVAAAVIGDVYPPQERAQAMSVYQTLLFLGPVFGPVVGGLIATYLNRQWAFVLLTAAGLSAWLGITLGGRWQRHWRRPRIVGHPQEHP